jgi:hypothetical protein
MMRRAWLWVALAVLAASACADRDLRGTYEKSRDGRTYLAVVDDNGGGCGPILVDGKVWPHAIGQAAEVKPGHHKIYCGGEIGFTIPAGVVYHFDYWGP